MGKKLKIYRLNEFDIWAGYSLSSTKKAYMELTGCDKDDSFDGSLGEIPESDWGNLKVITGEDDTEVLTFREYLQRLIKEKTKFPCEFASTED